MAAKIAPAQLQAALNSPREFHSIRGDLAQLKTSVEVVPRRCLPVNFWLQIVAISAPMPLDEPLEPYEG